MGNDLVQRKERAEVNYFEAVKLLNEVKDGVNHSTESITYALFLTGDISDGMRGETLGQDIQRNESRSWADYCLGVVGANNPRH
jgi:hypothetical protein